MALASADCVESVVGLSESFMYRRMFSSVYDTLGQVSWDVQSLLKAKFELFAETCEALEGSEVYSGDSTFIQRSDATTLEGRGMKRLASGALVYGYESYGMCR